MQADFVIHTEHYIVSLGQVTHYTVDDGNLLTFYFDSGQRFYIPTQNVLYMVSYRADPKSTEGVTVI